MIRKHAASTPAGSLHRPLIQQPFIEQILLSLQPQYGNGLGANPTCQELSPFVSSCNEPAYVTSTQVMRRMDEAHAKLPHSQQELATEHCGFLLEHFSRHGSGRSEHICSQCGVVVDIHCTEHVYRMAQLIFCSEQCYEDSLPAYFARLKFKRRELNPNVHPFARGPHAGDVPMHVVPTVRGSGRAGSYSARVVAAAYIKAQFYRASLRPWLHELTRGSMVLSCTLQFLLRSPFGGPDQVAAVLGLPTDTLGAILGHCFTSHDHRLVPQAADHWQDTGIIRVAESLRLWVLSQDALNAEQLPEEIKTNFVQFLDVVVELMGHIYHACDTTSSGEARERLKKVGQCGFHHDLAVTRLAALHYRCRALAASRYLYWRRCNNYMLELSQVCRAMRHLIHGQLRSERGTASDAFEVCCPSIVLGNLTTTGPMLNRWNHEIEYSVTEEIAFSDLLSPPHLGDELWFGLKEHLGLDFVMPGPRSPEEMALATSHAVRATSAARVHSHQPAAPPAAEAEASLNAGNPVPSPLNGSDHHPDPGGNPSGYQLSADGHVLAEWNPRGSATSLRADITVVGYQETIVVDVEVGTWTGLHFRMLCSQLWIAPLAATGMELYLWQGDLAALTDEDSLDIAINFSSPDIRVRVSRRPHSHQPSAFPPVEAGASLSVNDPIPSPLDSDDHHQDPGGNPSGYELTAVGHVTAGWSPPGNATGDIAVITVVGHQENIKVEGAVGTWTGLDFRRVCCQRWCVPLASMSMGRDRWQGDRAALADEDSLDAAIDFGAADIEVHVARRNFRNAAAISVPGRTQRLQLSKTGHNAGNCFVAALLAHTNPQPGSQPTIDDVNSLRADTGLPSSGSTDAVQMVQLLTSIVLYVVVV